MRHLIVTVVFWPRSETKPLPISLMISGEPEAILYYQAEIIYFLSRTLYSRLLSYCSVKLAEMRVEGYIFHNPSPSGLGCY